MKLLAPALLVSAILAATPAPAQDFNLPDIGEPSREYISQHQEDQIGAAVVRQIRAVGLILNDPLMSEYINHVGQNLATYADTTGQIFTFFMVKDMSINAFALPGGYIGVHAGLLLRTSNESELAGVMAHEIAHVTQRHIARAYAESERMRVPMLAGLVAAAILASQSSQGGRAAMTAAMAAPQQFQINFTRQNEYEADRVGTDLLIRADFDPAGMADFFEKLYKASGSFARQAPEYLRTHPLELNRITETRARTAGLPAHRPQESPFYETAKARLLVLASDDLQQAIRQLSADLNHSRGEVALGKRYGLAFALQRSGDLGQAARHAEQLLKARSDRLPFVLLAADIELQRGNVRRGWAMLDSARTLFPGDYMLETTYADALIDARQFDRALQMLRPLRQSRPGEPLVHQLYAEAAQGAGRRGESHASMAEYYYLNGRSRQAMEQLQLAMQSPDLPPARQAQLRDRMAQLRQEMEFPG